MPRQRRIDRLRDAMHHQNLGAMLITKGPNLRWLAGFTGSAGQLLVTSEALVFVTDGRYGEQATLELGQAGIDAEIIVSASPGEVLPNHLGRHQRLGLEAHAVTWSAARQIKSAWFTDTEVVATEDLVESLREVKDPAEVARIEAAAAIADDALAAVIHQVVPGSSERSIAAAIEATMVEMGADGPAFDTIVASGINGARPHHRPSHRRLEPGDLVVIDMGAAVDGYCSDMTRTFALGSLDPTQQRMLDVTTAAQAAGVAAVRAGVEARAVDATARAVIAEAGWAEHFVHPTGHGLGLEIHEPLRLAARSDATLAAGHVVTVEPGVYLPGVGGVRVEDTVEVTPEGSRVLTRSALPVVVG